MISKLVQGFERSVQGFENIVQGFYYEKKFKGLRLRFKGSKKEIERLNYGPRVSEKIGGGLKCAQINCFLVTVLEFRFFFACGAQMLYFFAFGAGKISPKKIAAFGRQKTLEPKTLVLFFSSKKPLYQYKGYKGTLVPDDTLVSCSNSLLKQKMTH